MGGDAPWPTPEMLKGFLEDATDAAQNTYGTARGEANLGYVPQVLRNLGKGKSRGSYERGVNSRIHSPVADSRARTHV